MPNLIPPKGVLEMADSAAYLLRRNLGPLLLLGLYSQIPWSLLNLFLNPALFLRAAGGDPMKFMGALGLFYLLLLLIGVFWVPVMLVAIFHVGHSYVTGEPVSAGRSLEFAFRNYGRAFGTYFLYIMVVGMAATAAGIVLGVIIGIGGVTGPVGIVLGLLVAGPVLLAGILYFVIGFLMTMPVLTVEGISGSAALKRAWDLAYRFHEAQTESKTWVRFLLLTIVYWLVALSLWGAWLLPNILISALWSASHAPGSVPPLYLRAIGELFLLGMQVMNTTYHSLLFYFLYLDVRVRYEAFDLQLAVQAPVEGPSAPLPEAT